MKYTILLFALVWAFAQSEVMVQVSFNIAAEQNQEDAATDVGAYLASPNLKWLRYSHILVSGAPGPMPMRIATLMFDNMTAWANFEQESLQHTQALMDNSWVRGRRQLWDKSETAPFPQGSTPQSDEFKGGYIYVLQYSALPNRAAEVQSRFDSLKKTFSNELTSNPGYLQSADYSASQYQSSFTNMRTFEFNDLPSLTKAVYSEFYVSWLDGVSKFLKDYTVTILAPGTDEAAGKYWNGGQTAAADEL